MKFTSLLEDLSDSSLYNLINIANMIIVSTKTQHFSFYFSVVFTCVIVTGILTLMCMLVNFITCGWLDLDEDGKHMYYIKTYCTLVYSFCIYIYIVFYFYSNEIGGALRGTSQGPVLKYLWFYGYGVFSILKKVII